MCVRELNSIQFTERLEPIFRSVESRLPEHLRGRKAEYFFPRWRSLMDLKVARTWELSGIVDEGSDEFWGAVLGMLITPDIFSGVPVAHIPFWFSIPGTKGTRKLLDAAENAAKTAGCARISIAAFDCLNGDHVAELYSARDYVQTERTFTKELSQ